VLGLRTSFDDWIDKETATKLTPIAKVPFPSVFLTVDQQTEIKTLRSDLDKYVKEMEAKFVTGAEPLSNWDKYIAQMKKMGYEKLVSTYQQAYDTWAASK
jgi:putative aldouronate transport system substrate-binding protein